MRAIKMIAYVLGGIAALLAILLLGVWLFVNPNDFKGRIAQEVKAATGRELTLDGSIKLSVFPWVALELGPASLGNPSGFGTEPFVSVQHAALRVKLLPLLHKQLQIGRIQVDGLDLRLKKNEAGTGNWEDFGRKSKPESGTTVPPTSTALPELAGVTIQNSRISYDTLTLANFNLEIGQVGSRSTVPIKARFDVDRGPQASALSLTAELNAKLDTEAKRYGLNGVTLSGNLTSKTDPRPVAWHLSLPAVDVDLTAQTLKAPAFTAQFAQAQLSGGLSGEKILDAPSITGTFKLEPLVLREFMGRLGVEPPKTRDAQALSKFAAAAGFAYGDKALKIENLDVQLDESKLTGAVAVTNLDTKALKFDLNLDRIDADRYLSPERSAPKPDGKPAELPTEQLKAVDANGTIAIGQAQIAGVALTNVRVSVASKDGVVRVNPAKAALYGGQYSGDITYDVHGAAPALKLDQTMTGIDIAQLLKASLKSERLSGRGNASTKLAGSGRTSDALIKSLSGRVDANLANGAVEGIDLWYQIGLAESLLKQHSMPAGSSSGRTKFDTFKMSADIAGGVATTKDLNIASQNLRVTGQGTANLTTKAIDYKIVATILKAPPAANGPDLSQLALANIPVNITGTMSDPKVKPDLAGIAKAKLQQAVDQKKDELKQKLQDKLKGLFGN
jgi:AsmA protein